MASVSTVGAFNRAWTLGTRFRDVNYRITEMLFPTLVYRREAGDLEGVDRAMVDSIRYQCAVMLFVASAGGGAAYGVMALFGPGFDRAANALALILLLPVIIGVVSIQGTSLWAVNRAWITSVISIARMFFTVGLMVVLTMWIGITGTALASVVGYLGSAIWNFVVARRHMSQPVRALWAPRQMLGQVLAYAGGFASARAVDDIIDGPLGLIAALRGGRRGLRRDPPLGGRPELAGPPPPRRRAPEGAHPFRRPAAGALRGPRPGGGLADEGRRRRRRLVSRVLIVGKGAPDRGGISAFLASMMGSGLTTTHDVTFLNLTRDEVPKSGRLTTGNITRTLTDAVAVLRASGGVDIVHVHTALVPGVTLVRVGLFALAARARGARPVVHAHSGKVQRWLTTRPRRLLARVMLLPAARVVAVSEGGQRALVAATGRPVRLIENGVDARPARRPRARTPARRASSSPG